MAIEKVVVSDLSRKPDAATVAFGLGGMWYEVDLSPDEQQELEEKLEPYMKVGREAGPTLIKKRVVPDTTVEEREEIREWAREQGYEVNERGRIPKKTMKAYDEAHGIDRSMPEVAPSPKVAPETTVEEREEIREWAREQGYEVNERGRIPKKVKK
ncbi:Lsr2 family protein, partial [Streptomyces sp. NPDC059788]|uniref:histone-like nucleoid-structuring protein Lsr2 n=1 Tax=Streptomyces sp. NPDC059788 TaxID=3346948 RepID=UPI003657D10A